MFDENGETVCPKCKNINPEICLFCKGHGKVDWLELATGGKKIKVWPYYHKDGCGKIMFYFALNPVEHFGEIVKANDIILIDGSKAQPKDLIKCPHCGGEPSNPLKQKNFGMIVMKA